MGGAVGGAVVADPPRALCTTSMLNALTDLREDGREGGREVAAGAGAAAEAAAAAAASAVPSSKGWTPPMTTTSLTLSKKSVSSSLMSMHTSLKEAMTMTDSELCVETAIHKYK